MSSLGRSIPRGSSDIGARCFASLEQAYSTQFPSFPVTLVGVSKRSEVSYADDDE